MLPHIPAVSADAREPRSRPLRAGFAGALGLLALASALGCQGQGDADADGVGGGSNGGGSNAGAPPNSGQPVPLDCREANAARAPLRRLTRFEYNNTVRDLLGVGTRPADALPGEELGNGFGNDADALGVSRLLIDGHRNVAAKLARELTQDAASAIALAGCDPAALGDVACGQQFIQSFLLRAFRRPVEPADASAYEAAFTKGRELGADFASGIRAVVERVLQTPQFLYRVEFGEVLDATRQVARPTGYEMATRLSYLMWGTLPDQALFDSAQQGKLDSKEGVLAAARRLLADPRAREVVSFFHGQLLGTRGLDALERNAEFYPSFKPGMGALFRQETEHFLDDVVWNGSGGLGAMFTAPYTFVNAPLAAFYGIPGSFGDAFQKVEVNLAQRSGLLTQSSILALTTPGSRTDPVVRGKWVYSKLLCGGIGDPPPNLPTLPEPEPGLSVRDRLATHREVEPCKTCHKYLDPLGFGFEHYDGVGLWRDADNGIPVDDSGSIEGTDVAGTFQGVIELGQKLAASKDVQKCFVGHWLTYAYGRAENDEDACSRASLEAAFEAANGSVTELLIALTQTDAFLHRPMPTQTP